MLFYEDNDNNRSILKIFSTNILGMIAWVHSEIAQGTDLRVVLGSLVPDGTEIPEDLDDGTLWQLIISIITEPPRRKKLKDVATLEMVVELIRSCKKIVVLTGAGVSGFICCFVMTLRYGIFMEVVATKTDFMFIKLMLRMLCQSINH